MENFDKAISKIPKVLIVDDHPVNLRMIGRNLKREGIKALFATSGKQSLTTASREIPDLILLDIMMPEMDGYEVFHYLKMNPKTSGIPIIFLTAKINIDDVLKAFQMGAVDYITKPFNLDELLARVMTQLRLKFFRDEIESKNNLLDRMNSEKNEILTIAAHDLKNPLFNISMLSKMIRDEEALTPEEIYEYSNDIVQTSDRMLGLISNLIDINALDEGKVKIFIEPIIISKPLINAVQTFEKRAAAKNIRLKHRIEIEGLVVDADRIAISQVLENLISNAIKFSPQGKEVIVSLSENGEYARIEVEDQGPGISDEDKKRLFNKFSKLSAKPTGDENSTGLGLSIVKRYVEEMYGHIGCNTELGRGTTFYVDIPLSSI